MPLDPKVERWRNDAREDPERFWARAAEELPWFRTWERVLEWPAEHRGDGDAAPAFRWYLGARTNLAYICVDRHVSAGAGAKLALITENERGERRALSYAELLDEVKRAGAALRGLGVRRGDRIAIYMPTCAEAIVLMLAAIRIGAIILVVFAGFGAGALSERIRLAG